MTKLRLWLMSWHIRAIKRHSSHLTAAAMTSIPGVEKVEKIPDEEREKREKAWGEVYRTMDYVVGKQDLDRLIAELEARDDGKIESGLWCEKHHIDHDAIAGILVNSVGAVVEGLPEDAPPEAVAGFISFYGFALGWEAALQYGPMTRVPNDPVS